MNEHWSVVFDVLWQRLGSNLSGKVSDAEVYKWRHLVENDFAKIKEF